MSTTEVLIAGFGGQGILFAGKFLAYAALLQNRNVSWLPSYGPEMRGGTANCSIILSDVQVGSPIVSKPDILIAMNLPSLDKYESTVAPGGKIFVDSSLIERKVERTDVDVYYVPATKLASDSGLTTLANMIILGKMVKETGAIDFATIDDGLTKVVSAKRANLLDANRKALEMGYNY
jgi:2-oxoglutarate ferredoxin oxidoreductase subunit gamma